ncbi:MAG: hypothetical protein WDN29_00695 [Methylovirgula sp.]
MRNLRLVIGFFGLEAGFQPIKTLLETAHLVGFALQSRKTRQQFVNFVVERDRLVAKRSELRLIRTGRCG